MLMPEMCWTPAGARAVCAASAAGAGKTTTRALPSEAGLNTWVASLMLSRAALLRVQAPSVIANFGRMSATVGYRVRGASAVSKATKIRVRHRRSSLPV